MGDNPMALGRRLLTMWNYEKRLQFPVNIKAIRRILDFPADPPAAENKSTLPS